MCCFSHHVLLHGYRRRNLQLEESRSQIHPELVLRRFSIDDARQPHRSVYYWGGEPHAQTFLAAEARQSHETRQDDCAHERFLTAEAPDEAFSAHFLHHHVLTLRWLPVVCDCVAGSEVVAAARRHQCRLRPFPEWYLHALPVLDRSLLRRRPDDRQRPRSYRHFPDSLQLDIDYHGCADQR